MEPISAILAGAQILNVLGNVFGAHVPSAAEIAAQQAQAAAAAAAARNRTLLTVGLAGAGVLLAVLLLRD